MTSLARRAGTWLYGQPYLLLSLTAFFWSSNIVIGRFIAGHVPPIGLSYVRWWISFCIVLPFAWPHLKRDWPTVRAHLPLMALLSVCGISVYTSMAYYGLQYTQAINGVLMQSTAPVLIAIWCLILFRERLTAPQMLGIATSFAGVLVIVSGGSLATLAALNLNEGDVWILSALILYGLYSAMLRRRPALHWLSFLAATFGLGAFLLTPAFLWEVSTGYTLSLDATTLIVMAYVSVFPSIVAYLCFNRGVELIGPNRAGPFFHLIPLFGSVLAITFLGERFQLFHALAYALILTGIVVASRRR